jgi:hypothetical protein
MSPVLTACAPNPKSHNACHLPPALDAADGNVMGQKSSEYSKDSRNLAAITILNASGPSTPCWQRQSPRWSAGGDEPALLGRPAAPVHDEVPDFGEVFIDGAEVRPGFLPVVGKIAAEDGKFSPD